MTRWAVDGTGVVTSSEVCTIFVIFYVGRLKRRPGVGTLIAIQTVGNSDARPGKSKCPNPPPIERMYTGAGFPQVPQFC